MYANKNTFALLTKKIKVFLLETFSNTYQKLGQSSVVKGQDRKITYKFASLNITVDKRQMPLGFRSEHLSLYDKYDHCHKLLCDKTSKSKLNLKEIIEADKDSPQNQRIENKDDILEIFRKDKQALPKVEQAYFIALEKFLNTNIVI
ncbi:37917_t:CDS:2 [Gigaspora margarita]|uniref:37917_t:CDS:1 n=1 Tax=Gigaspora margarita TaxID=4874 RepID=A0ABN7VGD4_GIGMA|nr:37917_t:CDS:2 [Gigaspora margarita]